MAVEHLIHTAGDTVLVMSRDGKIHAYVAQVDGRLEARPTLNVIQLLTLRAGQAGARPPVKVIKAGE